METDTRPVAGWFWLAAIASLLFMLVGCAGFVMDVMTDPHTLDPAQRALFVARPTWMKGAYTIAVWSGLAGTVILLLRRRLAELVLLVSLAATVLTFLPYAIVPAVRAAVATSDVIAAIVVIALVALIYGFARKSRQRGWLR
jgi:hypothetical protein